jgi:hypothetical protein
VGDVLRVQLELVGGKMFKISGMGYFVRFDLWSNEEQEVKKAATYLIL